MCRPLINALQVLLFRIILMVIILYIFGYPVIDLFIFGNFFRILNCRDLKPIRNEIILINKSYIIVYILNQLNIKQNLY